MPGRLFLTSDMARLGAALGEDLGDLANHPPRQNIAPGQQIIALTSNGLQLMRWGIIPVGRVNARGRPVMETLINARSETVFSKSAFDGVGRAVVPVNGWYEWTGERRHKTAWRIRPVDQEFLWFAAITDVWRAPGGLLVPQVATLTCTPNADVATVHHRMGVLLAQHDITRWLEGTADEVATLMVPWPNGRLEIEQARNVDWDRG